MLTVLEVIKRSADFLTGKGVEHARLNAELLVGQVLALPRMQLYLQFDRPLAETELEQLRSLVRRRSLREPLQYILGETEFHGLRIKVDRRALIPRPETEHLVELIGQRLNPPPRRLLDLGTGSGVIALSMARRYPEAEVMAVDSSPAALELARENAALNSLSDRVHWLQSDWFEEVPALQFDLIVSNPPYLSEDELGAAEPEVRTFEPRGALTPGGDGLSALRKIMATAPRFLHPEGLLALETGPDQHPALREAARLDGYPRCESGRDLAGRDRCLLLWRQPLSPC